MLVSSPSPQTLYHGKVTNTIAEAETLSGALDPDQAKTDIINAITFLSERAAQADPSVAMIGFSLGAYLALDCSVTNPEHIRSVVIFYGTGPTDYSNSKAAYLGHFAENDEFEPKASVDELEESLKRADRPVTFYHYPDTGHWFFEPDRIDAYNKSSAK